MPETPGGSAALAARGTRPQIRRVTSHPPNRPSRPENPGRSLLAIRFTGVRRGEARIVLLSAAYFFCLLSAYYVLRPIRDQFAVSEEPLERALLFTATLVGMLVAHPIFASLVSRWPRRRFVTVTYRFFMVCLLAFYVLLQSQGEAPSSVWAGRSYFVWTSVFNLFVVSVFWSFMTDMYPERDSRRLFGLIGVGGTLGAMLGSTITAFLVEVVGVPNLFLFSILLLECAVFCVKALDRRAGARSSRKPDAGVDVREPAPGAPIGGSAFEGIKRVASSRYLLGICVFMLFFTFLSTFLYFFELEIVKRTFATATERTSVLARIELAVNTLTLLVQLFLTGRILKWLGVGLTLAIIPLISIVGFMSLGLAPVFAVLVVFWVLRRGGNFAIAVPAREVLYTVLPRRDKYKAKNFNDTIVYRFGDQVGAWSFAGLGLLGLGTASMAWLVVPVAGAWVLVALWLGKKQKALANQAG